MSSLAPHSMILQYNLPVIWGEPPVVIGIMMERILELSLEQRLIQTQDLTKRTSILSSQTRKWHISLDIKVPMPSTSCEVAFHFLFPQKRKDSDFYLQSIHRPWSKKARKKRGDPGPVLREQHVNLGTSPSDFLVGVEVLVLFTHSGEQLQTPYSTYS